MNRVDGRRSCWMWKLCTDLVLDICLSGEREGVTSMLQDGDLYIGRGDGVVDCYRDGKLYSFQAFEPEFDYLESCDVVEKVLAIKKLHNGGRDDILVVGNERNLKIWRIKNKCSVRDAIKGLYSEEYDCTCAQECKNVHPYVLNSLSVNNDGQYLLSSDYLKINVWKPEKMDVCFSIIDVKPRRYDSFVFLINATKFNPAMNTVFGYSTSSGKIHINDLRLSSRSSEVSVVDCSGSEGTDGTVKSVSDFQFVDQNLLAARSLNSVALYDQRNMEKEVFSTTLCDDQSEIDSVYKSDVVYAKFKISYSKNRVFTGGFNDAVCIINIPDGSREDVAISTNEEIEGKDRLKLVVAHDDKFAVICDGHLLKYQFVL